MDYYTLITHLKAVEDFTTNQDFVKFLKLTYLRKNPEQPFMDFYFLEITEPRYFLGGIEFKILNLISGETTYMYLNEKDFKYWYGSNSNRKNFSNSPDM